MTDRQRASSGSPFEAQFGFCRAVRTGNRIVVSGTGPIEDNGESTPGGAAEQAQRCLTLIVKAIEDLGGNASDVVRTRMLLTDPDDQAKVGEVHARFFGANPPAATMAGAAWLCRPEWKVEIEAEAIVS
ncbi:MAG: RidA family protein [Erythrobacter sp.]